jgi:hypothetical protein
MFETLHEFLHRRPFQPFEVHLSNGNSFAVKHPDFADLLKTKIVIALPETSQVVVCFLLHIAEVRMAVSS